MKNDPNDVFTKKEKIIIANEDDCQIRSNETIAANS